MLSLLITSYRSEVGRPFFINKLYNGCPGDAGWFLVLEALTSVTSCTWDKAAHYPMFIYSNSDAAGVWQAGSGGLSG